MLLFVTNSLQYLGKGIKMLINIITIKLIINLIS